MTVTDWWVVGVYMTLMLTGAWHLGRTQSSRTDYYLGGNRLPGWTLATSVLATQCSTNSLLGAPAFVGFIAGGACFGYNTNWQSPWPCYYFALLLYL